jgi:hypothetical protein
VETALPPALVQRPLAQTLPAPARVDLVLGLLLSRSSALGRDEFAALVPDGSLPNAGPDLALRGRPFVQVQAFETAWSTLAR